jgi:tight adherence protein B
VVSVAPLLAVAVVVAGACVVRRRPPRHPGVGAPARPTSEPPRWFVERAAAADLAPVDRWWRVTWLGPVVGGLLAGVAVAPAAGLLVGVGVASGEVVALHLCRGRADVRLARSVPDALDAVARSCRSGSSLVSALGELDDGDGPAGPVFADVSHRVRHGVSLREALDDVLVIHPEPAMRLAAAALLVGSDTGAAPARAVEGVAATLRDRAALDREAAAQATQATASAAVLVVAPVGFGVVAAATDPRVGAFLVSFPFGVGCLAAGASLDLVGAWWMHRLVRGAR